MTTVVNVRGYRGDMRDVRMIDRSTVYGNPYKVEARGILARVGQARHQVLRDHLVWWYHPDQRPLRAQARRELTDMVLMCHCKPLACHGDTIAIYLDQVVPFLAAIRDLP